MYKRLFLLFLMLAANHMAHSQESLNGRYDPVSSRNQGQSFALTPLDYIYIKDDTLEYILYYYALSPPESQCKVNYHWVNEHFIELQSTKLKNIVDDSLRVHQFKSGFSADSLIVCVSVPESRGFDKVKCNILYLSKNDDSEVWKETAPAIIEAPDCLKVRLPARIGEIALRIEPDRYPYPSVHPAKICATDYKVGYIYYLSPKIKVKEDTDSIVIEIPGINAWNFSQYVADGDYIKVEENRLIWHGDVFEKTGDEKHPYPIYIETILLHEKIKK